MFCLCLILELGRFVERVPLPDLSISVQILGQGQTPLFSGSISVHILGQGQTPLLSGSVAAVLAL